MSKNHQEITTSVTQWLEQVVIGLRLCPFAKAPYQKQQIRLVVSDTDSEELLIKCLVSECEYLETNSNTETTLIICANLLNDFFDYNQFLQWAEQTLKSHQWQGVYQIASFHPDYQFMGTDIDDVQNLTNRSPYPILHLLREKTLSQILENYENPDDIPQRNIETMRQLSEADKQRYFAYLFSD